MMKKNARTGSVTIAGVVVAGLAFLQFVQQNGKSYDLPQPQNSTDFPVTSFGRVVIAVVSVSQISVVDFENSVPLMIG